MPTATLDEIRDLLVGLAAHVTQLGANVEDLRVRQLEHGRKLDALASVAQEARAGVVIVHESVVELRATCERLADGVMALAADLQAHRVSAFQQASHEAEHRTKLEQTVTTLERDFHERERAGNDKQ
jgi:hypothetical protein